jgi:hypothetical protein
MVDAANKMYTYSPLKAFISLPFTYLIPKSRS